MKTNLKKGFTLIELLVVIAIIGILSSVVLASLNTARNKGADAAVKSNLNGIRAQAELWYDNNGNTYGPTVADTSCTGAGTSLLSDNNVKNAIAAATAQKATGANVCIASSTAWAVNMPLKGSAGNWYCLDSSGYATTTGSNTLGATDSSCL